MRKLSEISDDLLNNTCSVDEERLWIEYSKAKAQVSMTPEIYDSIDINYQSYSKCVWISYSTEGVNLHRGVITIGM